MIRYLLLALFCCASLAAQAALNADTVKKLAAEESEDKIAAIRELTQSADPAALALLKALNDEALYVAGEKIYILVGNRASDAVSGATITPTPQGESLTINNRIRSELASAMASLRLFDTDRTARLAAAKEVQTNIGAAMAPLLAKAIALETDAEIKAVLVVAHAQASLSNPDPQVRLAAVKALGESADPAVKNLLTPLGQVAHEPDDTVRNQALIAIRNIESRLAWGENLGRIFSGISLGSILLLAALGLAITYGVMGVINMAHGELLMIGAYATYGVQSIFRAHFPSLLDWYVVAAIPVAFFSAALIGALMERTVIRWLYGRALETLLATWGLSLILIQAARLIFGAQNVEVANPSWMSGGVAVMSNLQLPLNRLIIIGFSVFVLILIWLLMNKTRLGMFVRAVTQNRSMAGCVGVPTARIDTLAFALGAGIAGLGGVALSQIANVGPDMGQGYIVDSFMVVVLGGVGQLAGAVWAALGLGILTKFIEGWAGAVVAKILVLVFIVVFIQKRPQGLFALKGRFVEN